MEGAEPRHLVRELLVLAVEAHLVEEERDLPLRPDPLEVAVAALARERRPELERALLAATLPDEAEDPFARLRVPPEHGDLAARVEVRHPARVDLGQIALDLEAQVREQRLIDASEERGHGRADLLVRRDVVAPSARLLRDPVEELHVQLVARPEREDTRACDVRPPRALEDVVRPL